MTIIKVYGSLFCEGKEKIMKTRKLTVGDEVYLVSNRYIPSEFNPTKGSSYECKGIIHKVLPKGTVIKYTVKWNNGITNYYGFKNDLMLVDPLCNNYKNIW